MWTCGGSIEVVPCSKIAHIERAHKPYMPDLSMAMKRNALRVAEVWMDEFKHNINLAWNLPFEVQFLGVHTEKLSMSRYLVNFIVVYLDH